MLIGHKKNLMVDVGESLTQKTRHYACCKKNKEKPPRRLDLTVPSHGSDPCDDRNPAKEKSNERPQLLRSEDFTKEIRIGKLIPGA
jgi:hypothetical protein